MNGLGETLNCEGGTRKTMVYLDVELNLAYQAKYCRRGLVIFGFAAKLSLSSDMVHLDLAVAQNLNALLSCTLTAKYIFNLMQQSRKLLRNVNDETAKRARMH